VPGIPGSSRTSVASSWGGSFRGTGGKEDSNRGTERQREVFENRGGGNTETQRWGDTEVFNTEGTEDRRRRAWGAPAETQAGYCQIAASYNGLIHQIKREKKAKYEGNLNINASD